jgi:hypothetical protein
MCVLVHTTLYVGIKLVCIHILCTAATGPTLRGKKRHPRKERVCVLLHHVSVPAPLHVATRDIANGVQVLCASHYLSHTEYSVCVFPGLSHEGGLDPLTVCAPAMSHGGGGVIDQGWGNCLEGVGQ